MKRERRVEEDAEQFGFRWGQLDVIRMAEFPEGKVVGIETDFKRIEVYVSPGGRSIRVWRDGKELT